MRSRALPDTNHFLYPDCTYRALLLSNKYFNLESTALNLGFLWQNLCQENLGWSSLPNSKQTCENNLIFLKSSPFKICEYFSLPKILSSESFKKVSPSFGKETSVIDKIFSGQVSQARSSWGVFLWMFLKTLPFFQQLQLYLRFTSCLISFYVLASQLLVAFFFNLKFFFSLKLNKRFAK